MCEGCYEELGRPAIVNDKTIAAADLVRRVYELSCVGGDLHIVLDDWNLEDDHVQFCDDQIAGGGSQDREGPELLAIERECCDAFKAMTIEERASALALHDGYLSRDGQQSP